ncbi:MAG TPA: alpha/beta fold hydrolase [Pyrinomonadaceae bacterium]|jgi:medium-chain acyl-[acyl-carrier-protein] hydrolase
MSESTDNVWLAKSQPAPQARVRLFCFPYAGGSSLTFRRWPEALSPEVEVCPVQLPGRGSRMSEPPLKAVHDIVEAFLPVMARRLDKPFAFFGHSMGGAIAFELSRRLRSDCGVEPLRLFISGRRAPHLAPNGPVIYDLPEPEFKEELRRLNGTPAELLEHPEMMEILVPLLRADISVSQTYRCDSRLSLTCPMTIYGGLEDAHDEPAGLAAWREHTLGPFELKMFAGDHFFINTAQPQLLDALRVALNGV